MDGAAVVGAHGEDGLADHGPEGLFGEGQGVLVFHCGQLREVLRVDAEQVELAVSTGDVDFQSLLLEQDHVVGQLADDLSKQAGGEDHGTGLGDIGLDGRPDAGLLVIAGEEDGAVFFGFEQKSFQSRDGAFGRNGTGSGEDGRLQQCFFTAEFHGKTSDSGDGWLGWGLME